MVHPRAIQCAIRSGIRCDGDAGEVNTGGCAAGPSVENDVGISPTRTDNDPILHQGAFAVGINRDNENVGITIEDLECRIPAGYIN